MIQLRTMSQKQHSNIIDCYDKVASNYADKFFDELADKPLNKILLKAFAEKNKHKGRTLDLGCGPGQTTRFLYDNGVTNIAGNDISPGMIKMANELSPSINFEVADMLQLAYPDASFAAAIAFYAIVHFDYESIGRAFSEINRILKNHGEFLFSFHVGGEHIHLDTFLDHAVNIDFHFFDPRKIENLLLDNNFVLIDSLVRQPYRNTEHPSERAYIWAQKK